MAKVLMEVPLVRPLGVELRPESAQEIWDAYILRGQEAEMLQSVEERMLMALLRAFAAAEIVEERE